MLLASMTAKCVPAPQEANKTPKQFDINALWHKNAHGILTGIVLVMPK
jgi:hypothetical protein